MRCLRETDAASLELVVVWLTGNAFASEKNRLRNEPEKDSAQPRSKRNQDITSRRKDPCLSRRMIQQGANIQGYDKECMDYLEELRVQKNEVDKQIEKLIKYKTKIQNEIEVLTEQLENICEVLGWKKTMEKELDAILLEELLTYDKILQTSKMLLNVSKTN